MAPLTGIRVQDIVEVDKKGRRFHAFVRDTSLPAEVVESGVKGTGLTIMPFNRHETYRFATAHEVVGVWRKAKIRSGRNGVRVEVEDA